MFMRPLSMVLAFTLLSGPVAAQRGPLDGSPGPRTDILTGEPVRPRTGNPRPEPEIFNAPHAPRQQPGRMSDYPPMEIYVAPQVGGGPGSTGASGQFPRRSVQQRQPYENRPSSQYPGRLPQERPY